MSHIPASAMPHAKSHDEEGTAPPPPTAASASGIGSAGDDAQAPDLNGKASMPEKDIASGADTAKAGGTASVPLLTIAAVGVLAIGGIVAAALTLRSDNSSHGAAKAKPKRKDRPRKTAKPD